MQVGVRPGVVADLEPRIDPLLQQGHPAGIDGAVDVQLALVHEADGGHAVSLQRRQQVGREPRGDFGCLSHRGHGGQVVDRDRHLTRRRLRRERNGRNQAEESGGDRQQTAHGPFILSPMFTR